MKKILTGLIICGIFTGCFSSPVKNPEVEKQIAWEYAGSLPAPEGYNKNIGLSGMMAGNIENFVIVGGGTNFPEKSILDGGEKKFYSDIFIFEDINDSLSIKNHINFKNTIGYGASVKNEKGIFYIGGSSNSEADNDILFFYMDKEKLAYKKIGDLPFSFRQGAAVEKDGKLYIIAGFQNGIPTNKMFEFDINSGKSKELPSVPGAKGRTQCIAQILNDCIYVFSGGNLTAFTDGYKYNFKTGKWTEVSSVEYNGEKLSLLGASSVKLNEYEMLVIGGFNKEVYDNAVKNLGILRGQELLKFKASYFEKDLEEFKWNKNILIYNAKTNKWKSIGELPFNAPCGEGLVLIKNKIYSIGGEIKPGIRTSKIYRGEILKK